MRRYARKLLRFFARTAINKYQTKLIVIYGWDWTEGLREVLYLSLRSHVNIRRNTKWIDWDLGLPLFILGENYERSSFTLIRMLKLAASLIKLIFPSAHREYLLVSLSAKSEDTLKYWLSLQPNTIVLLPLKEQYMHQLDLIESATTQTIIDLRAGANLVSAIDVNKLANSHGYRFNFVQIKLFELARSFTTKSQEIKQIRAISDAELCEAIAKVDWQDYLLDRIRRNLVQLEE